MNQARNESVSVQDPRSKSSLQLTLENKRVLQAVDAYIHKLQPVVDREEEVVGFVFAINGKINSADKYASSVLFKKLWPKLLKASAVEAVAEKTSATFTPLTATAVQLFLAEIEKGQTKETVLSQRLNQSQRENALGVQFETKDKDKNMALRVFSSAW